MKKKRFFIVYTLVFSLMAGCNTDDPDPRRAFAGTFIMNDFDVRIVLEPDDTIFPISSRAEVSFMFRENLKYHELEADLGNFIEGVIRQTLGAVINPSADLSVEIGDRQIIAVSGAEFETNEIDFEVSISEEGSPPNTSLGEFIATGVTENNELILDFEIVFYTGTNNFFLSGIARGSRE